MPKGKIRDAMTKPRPIGNNSMEAINRTAECLTEIDRHAGEIAKLTDNGSILRLVILIVGQAHTGAMFMKEQGAKTRAV